MILPKEWEEKELGEICDVKKGTSITKDKTTLGDIPVIAGGQQPAYFHNASNRKGKTITISASGAYAGFINYFETPIFASDCTTIQTKSEEKLPSKYVYLVLKSQQQRIYSLQTGAGQPHVYARDLIKIRIPIPPLPIQRKIVAVLEKAEAIKRKRQQVEELTNQVLQSVFIEMFGDPETNPMAFGRTPIDDILEEKQYGLSNKGNMGRVGYPIIGMNGIDYDGNLTIRDTTYVDISSKDFEKYCVKVGDLLFNRTNSRELIGKTGIVLKPANAVFASYLIRLQVDQKRCVPHYLWAFLNSRYLKKLRRQIARQAVSQANINSKELGLIRMPLPPLSAQQKFARIVEQLERLKQKQLQNQKYSEELFNSLMQKAFTGAGELVK